MSKELIERLRNEETMRYAKIMDEAADRIEELERQLLAEKERCDSYMEDNKRLAGERDALQINNAHLREQLAIAKEHLENCNVVMDATAEGWRADAAEYESMRQQLAEAQKDADRYRWLRHALSDKSPAGKSHYICSITRGHPEELDNEIDVWRAQQGGNGELLVNRSTK